MGKLMCLLLSACRWESHSQQWGRQLDTVPPLQETRARGCAVSDRAAPPGHSSCRPAATHHTDEVCRRLRVQGGVWGKARDKGRKGCNFLCCDQNSLNLPWGNGGMMGWQMYHRHTSISKTSPKLIYRNIKNCWYWLTYKGQQSAGVTP